MVSFMVALTSKPRNARQMRANHAAATSNSQIYAAHSVLSTGKWAKIRVPANGIYNLTADVVRRAGFSDLSKVRIYGYGGNLQNEKLSVEKLKELDDLKEVPSCYIRWQTPLLWTRTSKLGKQYRSYTHPQSLFRLWLLLHYRKRRSTFNVRC